MAPWNGPNHISTKYATASCPILKEVEKRAFIVTDMRINCFTIVGNSIRMQFAPTSTQNESSAYYTLITLQIASCSS